MGGFSHSYSNSILSLKLLSGSKGETNVLISSPEKSNGISLLLFLREGCEPFYIYREIF